MIRFANAQWLWLLAGLCVFIVFLWWTNRRRQAASHAFISAALSERIAYAHSERKRKWKHSFWVIALAFGIIALAGPQVGTRLEEAKREGIDIFIGLDVSSSMLCEDIRPSRLESAKHEILQFINGLKGDRVGLVAFAGTAVIHCPLTTDYGAVKLLIKVMSPDLLPEPGTALADAIDAARRSFQREETKSKVLVLVTDGEDHEEKAVTAAEDAAKEGIRIYTIGLGTQQGAPIPLYDSRGNHSGYKKDKQGEVILTHLNEMLLRRVAEAGNGQYLRGTQGAGELESIWADISSMEKQEMSAKKFTAYEHRFQYLVLPTFLLLVLEFFLSERRGFVWKSWLRKSVKTREEQERQAA
ncbi:VWA domain-containing protein [bacterium]|nr:VWA domain-containing protein [bacterium]